MENRRATPLHAAAENGSEGMVRDLISAGADWTKKTRDGRAAFDIATDKGDHEIILLMR